MSLGFLAALLLGVACIPHQLQAAPEPIRLSADIGGDRAVVEVRDLAPEAATLAARQALGTLAMIERELSPANPAGTIERLNATAGKGSHPIDGNIGRMLQSVLGFCLWSRNANGPLGGVLYDLWQASSMPPGGEPLEIGVLAASCQNLMLHPEAVSASVAAGSKLDLRHFDTGYAVDRAIQQLREDGVSNAWVEFRSVMRGIGRGPAGRGWDATLPLLPGMTEPLDPIRLYNQALAVVSTHRNRFRFGGTSYPSFLDQRSGKPAEGTLGVLVVTELALDAQAIGSSMVILGNREGQLRLGGVIPSPSVLWLLGDGSGEPLLTAYKWSEVRRR